MSKISNQELENAHGYGISLNDPEPIQLLVPVPQHLICVLCNKLMKDPIQTIRGELACILCYKNALGSSGICPIDKEPISESEYFKDKFKAREIRSLPCFCTNKDYGCNWNGEVAHFEEHYSHCKYEALKCPLCNDAIKHGNSMDDHFRECRQIVGQEQCFYSRYGCAVKIRHPDEHIIHLKQDTFIHSMMQCKYVESMQSTSMSLRNQIDSVKEISNVETEKMAEEIMFLNGQVLSLTNVIKEMQGNFSELSRNFTIGKTSTSNMDNKEDNGETGRLLSRVEAMNKKISEIDLKQQLFENTNYTGKILWKIDNFTFRMQQAVTGRVTALHSAPCFTEKYGHRFCGRLYLNGDGMGKCTHVSMFFIVMKSEYDNLLNWPFTRRIAFRLINQEDDSKSIFESFTSDRFSSSFQKPKKEMNVAAGCPMYISKDDLTSNGFVKDDAMFIEISVS